jgi:8-oxo-dGTP diphosphatase
MKRYVLGFLFNPYKTEVMLIRKKRPEWQKGFLNGVGGKIEGNETPMQAMARECNEESGARIILWKEFCTMYGTDWVVHCFWSTGDLSVCHTMEDEEIEFHNIEDIKHYKPLSNILWLIHLALDPDSPKVTVNY